ncbi:MAG TPA: hypothetical protein QGF58_17175 [Myxococcota bacterium]|nr:hypothetical protein [Myxococcota bacterium]
MRSTDPLEGLRLATEEDFDGFLVDIDMPSMLGTEWVERLTSLRPSLVPRVVQLTGMDVVDSTALPAPVVWKPLTRASIDRVFWWWGQTH